MDTLRNVTTEFPQGRAGQVAIFPGHDLRRCWYALYTIPRHEKSIAEKLRAHGVEQYLPLYSSVRSWNERKEVVELPLFPSYLFVRICGSDKGRVLSLTGAVRLVAFNGAAVAISEDEIDRLKASLAIYRAEPFPFLTVGKCVLIQSGPFTGMRGRIVRRKSGRRLILALDSIQSAIVLELDAAETQLAS